MHTGIFSASIVIIISVLICLVFMAFGIMLIIRGQKRRIRRARVRGIFVIILGFVIGFLVFLPGFAYIYIERLWFEHLGYLSVFWALASAPWFLFFKFTLIAGAFMLFNFILAWKLCPIPGGFHRWASGKTSTVNRLMVVAMVIVSIIMGSIAVPMWDEYRRYEQKESYVIKNPNTGQDEIIRDPQFGKDIGYYLFTFPIRNFTSLWTKGLFLITFALLGFLYNFYRGRDSQTKIYVMKRGVFHLSLLWILILMVSIWRSDVNILHLVFSQDSVAFGKSIAYGAGYTDVNILIPGYRIYMIIILLVALTVLINSFWRKRFLITVPIAVWLGSYFLLIWVIPYFYQNIKVSPNEENMEKDYISRTIEYSRMGYGLDRVRISEIIPEVATLEKVKSHPDTLKNVQLWDRRTTRDTLNATQVFRRYYTFNDVDADRYHLVNTSSGNSEYRQVMISAREIDNNKLESHSWVAQKLIYTHGYGVCMGPVNQFTQEGKPYLWIKGIPPDISRPELKITRPEIYYGEVTNNYVFVNTTQKEFDYPKTEGADKTEDFYTTYEGKGGIPIESLFRKIVLAVRFQDFRIIMSQHLKPDSRIIFNRQILDRVERIAPFLQYDNDPYIVIGDSGRLWWIVDVYAVSEYFPYSDPYYNKFNYIRNPIKAVIDAYNGDVSFYIWDDKEVITKVYEKAFPGLLKSRKEIPDGLEKHNRYPDDLTTIQSQMYCLYHMQDPQTFFSKGDRWDLPNEIYYQPGSSKEAAQLEEKSGKEGEKAGLKDNMAFPVKPIYVMINVPGDNKSEFTSIIPFTPYPTTERQNMVAWMIVRNDEPMYGDILVYTFPKSQTVSGPAQAESTIDTDPEISEKLTLWNDGGSQVIRGNILTIPVDNALFYVEPLYLQADIAKMPLLTQVIVVAGDRVAWGENFDLAVEKVFQVGEKVEGSTGTPVPTPATQTTAPATTTQTATPPLATPPATQTLTPAPAAKQSAAPDEKALKDMINKAKEQMSKGDTKGAAKTLDKINKAIEELTKGKK